LITTRHHNVDIIYQTHKNNIDTIKETSIMKSVMKLAILALIGAAASSASAHELRGHKVKVRRSIIA